MIGGEFKIVDDSDRQLSATMNAKDWARRTSCVAMGCD